MVSCHPPLQFAPQGVEAHGEFAVAKQSGLATSDETGYVSSTCIVMHDDQTEAVSHLW